MKYGREKAYTVTPPPYSTVVECSPHTPEVMDSSLPRVNMCYIWNTSGHLLVI